MAGRPLGGGVESLDVAGMGPMVQGDQAPAVLELKVVKSETGIPLAFRIERIPLKEFGRMPAALEALDFSGHDAPVSAEFVEFLQGGRAFGNPTPTRSGSPTT